MIDPISCSEEAAVASSSCPSEPPQDKAEQAAVHDDAVAYEEPLPLRYPRRHLRRRPAPGRRVPRSRLRHRGRRTLRYLQDLLLSAAAAAAAGCAGELSPAAVVLRRRPGAPSDEPCHALHDLFPGFTGLGSVVNWGGGGGGSPYCAIDRWRMRRAIGGRTHLHLHALSFFASARFLLFPVSLSRFLHAGRLLGLAVYIHGPSPVSLSRAIPFRDAGRRSNILRWAFQF